VVSGSFAFSYAFADVTIVPVAGSGAPGCESSGCYSPSFVTVDVGDRITFSNTDSAAHTFTAGTPGDGPTGEFDTSTMMAGNSFTYTPSSAGNIDYFCMVHPWMIGNISVIEAAEVAIPFTLSVRTDKSSYDEGDTIQITGEVSVLYSGTPMSVIVKDPNRNLVSIQQVTVDSNKKFNTQLDAGGSLMNEKGTYTVAVQYGTENRSDNTSFYFSGTVMIPTSTGIETYVETEVGSDTIVIRGATDRLSPNVALTIIAPNGDVISIDQVSPSLNGEFTSVITTGGPLWTQDGIYTVIAQQFDSSAYKASSEIYIKDGVVTTEANLNSPTYPSSAPYGTDVVIPRGTGVPGCENSNSCYSPYRITVDEGETISWYNADSAAHTVTAGTPGDGPTGEFDSGMMMAGNSFSSKMYSSGTIDYFCMMHPWMLGVVSVTTSYTPPSYTSPTSDSGKISVSGISVSYSITSGKLFSIMPDVEAKSLIVSISASSDGSITLTLPRTLIDAKYGVNDDEFFVLMDGEEIDFDEKNTSSSRIVTISFQKSAKELEIVGTQVISGPSTYTPPTYTPPTYTPPTYTPPQNIPALPVPSGTNIVIPSGTGAPGCEESNACYEPRTFSAGKYSTITWFNSDSAAHTVTSGSPGHGPDGEFDSGLFMSGGSFSHRFTDDGTYNYFCMVHPWMEGKVAITRSGVTIEAPTTPTPTPTPTPPPTPSGSISVSVSDSQYSPSDLVTVKVSASKSTNVAISVIGPNQDSVVSRSVSTDSSGRGSLQFKLPESSQNGSYRIDSTATISGNKVSDSASFTVKSTTARISITSLQPTDQQGNVVSSFTKGKLGFAKIVLSSDSSASSLVTINLFDSDLTSLGIGSFKTTLSSGQSEMTLSFFIPNDAEFGTGDIYANVFSDWPSQGGVPLTGESSSQVRIQ